MEYKLNITGCACDESTGFKCGFDITVENGGSIEQVGESLQKAIDGMKSSSKKEKEKRSDRE